MRRQIEFVHRILGVTGLVAAVAMGPCLPALAEPPAGLPEPPSPPAPRGGAAAPVDIPEAKLDDEAEPAPAVKRLLDAPYLSDLERQGVRIFHGVWTPTDVDGPAMLAKVSLMTGVLDDDIFAFEGADPLDRAEAAELRGDAELALSLTDGRAEPRAVRIRVEALLSVGKSDEALKAVEPLAGALTTGALTSADEIVEGVRALMLRARLTGADAGEFQAMNGVLAQVRDRIDRLYWPAQLAEAQLLADKDNLAHADKAALAVLALNPRAAEAWALRGQFASRAFDLKAAEGIAARLESLAHPGTSAYAGVVRARAAMRMRDSAGALEALEPLLSAYPRHREALALRAAALAVGSDFAGAERGVQAYEALAPGSPDAVLEVGKALSEARQYEESAAYLRRAVERAPKWSVPLIELGLVLNQAGQNQEARDALSDAARLDQFNVRAGNTLSMLENLLTYQTIESEHFVVHYRADKPDDQGPPQANRIMAREMIPVLERIHTTVAGNGPGGIDHEPAVKTQINLMPDHASFAVRIAGMPQIHTIAAATGPVIAMEAPREGKGHQGPYDWARVVQHEYTHTVTLSRTKNRIPHWFTEAAAVYLELSPRDYNAIKILTEAFATDQLFDFDEINLAFIRPRKPTDRAQAYAQGHWMYEFLVTRWGDRAPLALMDLYAQGKTEAEAFPLVVELTREEFFAEFRAWAGEKLVEWGMAPPAGDPSVRELLSGAARRESNAEGAEGGGGAPEPAVENPDDPREITPELVNRWLELHPKHPDLLELAVQSALRDARNKPTPEMIPLLERYAAARPVDPLPHKLLAKLLLDGAGNGPEAAIGHLEFLDAREQYTPAYAAELARRYSARAGVAGAPPGDWDRAQAKATRATQIAPFDADYRELAATIAIRRKDFPTARQHLEALLELEPDREIHKQRLEALDKLSAGK